jgi:hypothetical protein
MSARLENIAIEMLGSCPLPKSNYDSILLGHGSGGADQKHFRPGLQ